MDVLTIVIITLVTSAVAGYAASKIASKVVRKRGEKIIKEAARLGYEQVILPKRNAQKVGGSLDGCRVIGVKNIQEAIRVFSM